MTNKKTFNEFLKPKKRLFSIIPILLLACISITLCTNQNPTEITTTTIQTTTQETTSTTTEITTTIVSESPPTGPFRLNMTLEGVPKLNQPVNLTVIVWSYGRTDYPNTTINLSLNGFELLSGNQTWHGDFKSNTTVKLIYEIAANKIGNCTIKVNARYARIGAMASNLRYILANVQVDNATITIRPQT
jgi:hypothetical protein